MGYLIEPPAIINFSGGRSSAYMLIAIVAAHGGNLPDGVHVCFSNTGKERAETLDFVQEVANQVGVRIRWLERDASRPSHQRFREVDYESASRNGEPFEQVIREKQFLPNPMVRFCTVELKIRVMRDFAWSLGWESWTNVLGLRADEAHRLKRAFRDTGDGEGRQLGLLRKSTPVTLTERESKPHDSWNHPVAPMIEAGVTRQMVLDFWAAQPFDLRLQPHETNCDLCFLKGAGKVSAIMREHPSMADWWIRMESLGIYAKRDAGDQFRFRLDRPNYAALLDGVQKQSVFDFGEFDDMLTCASNGCTD